LRNDAKRAGEAESDTFRLSMTGGDAAERDIDCPLADADATSLRVLW
jgi:hypothetical protein